MDIKDLTLNQIESFTAAARPGLSHSFEIGASYLIRTVTMHHLGRLARVTDTDLVLEDASWLADSGRFSEALSTGNVLEVEPFTQDVIVLRQAIVDATKWTHPLPLGAK